MRVHWGPLVAGLSLVLAARLAGAADGTAQTARDKQALAPLQAFVGQWRGVGQPKRGSNQGAWTEATDWAWRFDDGRAELVAELADDKYYARFRLQPGDAPGRFVLLAEPTGTDGAATAGQRFSGSREGDSLVMTDDAAPADRPARIAMRLVAGGDRLLVLYEKRAGQQSFARLAEVGSTRKGSSFAKNAASGPECVVTGGLGTIAVEHAGKKYYVCCTGCRDLFNEDPESVLAEYRARKAAEREEKNK